MSELRREKATGMIIKEIALGALSVLYILILAGGLIYIPIACVVGLALGIAGAMQ